jgi:two-component system catabolic regulation response regulator CreB
MKNTITILVVEDEPAIAENISYALTTESFEPVVRGTGREALQALDDGGIDLIILDIGLPDVNGFDLLKEIRAGANTPVIVVTARSDEVDRVVGLEIGADDYVVKPFSPRELTARVRAVLRRYSDRTESEGSVSLPDNTPFTVDEDRMRITFFDEPVELSRYEYRLLCALIGQPGRVFSRRQLMDRAWDDPDMSLERTVDAHIKSIRQKLRGIRPDTDPIETHRGVGYSLKETW